MAPYQELLQVTQRFFYCLDEGQYDELLALMSPEAVWHRQGKILRGHPQIRAALEERSTTQPWHAPAHADFFNPGPERHPGDIESLLIAAWQEEDA
jgi:hypothetical protein